MNQPLDGRLNLVTACRRCNDEKHVQ
ncbi:MAG: HNH endonuclease [Oceanospirillaceae bacterium]|nr:HNH endonuclease [Oceanospirillaceae bacterium]